MSLPKKKVTDMENQQQIRLLKCIRYNIIVYKQLQFQRIEAFWRQLRTEHIEWWITFLRYK